ncbi:MAG TPA: hypothetical protein VGN01_15830 [Acidobacteriaceae bacterium]
MLLGAYSEVVKASAIWLLFGLTLVLCSSASCQIGEAKPDTVDLTTAQTVDYCELLRNSDSFRNKLVRVRVLYETDFELATISAPSCSAPIPTTWIDFEKDWEHRTRRQVRHAVNGQKWHVQTDVVFVGIFRANGHYGNMEMYPFLLDVYKVESIRDTGGFRPLPGR